MAPAGSSETLTNDPCPGSGEIRFGTADRVLVPEYGVDPDLQIRDTDIEMEPVSPSATVAATDTVRLSARVHARGPTLPMCP